MKLFILNEAKVNILFSFFLILYNNKGKYFAAGDRGVKYSRKSRTPSFEKKITNKIEKIKKSFTIFEVLYPSLETAKAKRGYNHQNFTG